MGVGKPGPIPKRSEDRLRRNKTGEDGLDIDQYDLEGEVMVPWAVFDHMFVQGLWESLVSSVNAKFYEPSDWQYARLTLHFLDKTMMNNKIPSATMLMALDNMLSKMLVTEADRRRLKIEAKRETNPEDKKVDAATAFRNRFEEQRRS